MTYRPVAARFVALGAGTSLLVVVVVVWAAMPPAVRASFTPFQTLTLAAVLGAVLGVLYGIARTRVETDEWGIHVVNGYRRHDLEWAQAVSVTLGRGAPWAVIDTIEGRSLMVLAIQASDGDRAKRAAQGLRAEIDARSPGGR